MERLKNNEKSLEEKLNDNKESFKDTSKSLESLNNKYVKTINDAKAMELKCNKLIGENKALSQQVRN